MNKYKFERLSYDHNAESKSTILNIDEDDQQYDCIIDFIEYYNAFHTLAFFELIGSETLYKLARDTIRVYHAMTVKAKRYFNDKIQVVERYITCKNEVLSGEYTG